MGAMPALVPYPRRMRMKASRIVGIVGQNRAEQCHRETNTADDGILPCSFKRGFASVKHNQKHRRQGSSLKRDPEYSQVVGEPDQSHSENQERHESVVLAQLVDGKPATQLLGLVQNSASLLVTKIADRIYGTDQGHKS